jgi:Mn-dependent DtxR family transcriptional regulator
MKKISEEGYVSFGPSHELLLSEAGQKIAKEVLAKRKLLKEALVAIGVSEKNAEADAHQIEHSISDETNKKLYHYLKSQIKKADAQQFLFLYNGGEGGVRTLARFHVCRFSKPVPSASWVLLHTVHERLYQ